MFCKNCGAEIKNNEKSCTQCGLEFVSSVQPYSESNNNDLNAKEKSSENDSVLNQLSDNIKKWFSKSNEDKLEEICDLLCCAVSIFALYYFRYLISLAWHSTDNIFAFIVHLINFLIIFSFACVPFSVIKIIYYIVKRKSMDIVYNIIYIVYSIAVSVFSYSLFLETKKEIIFLIIATILDCIISSVFKNKKTD